MLRVRVHDTMSRECEWARRKEISNLCKRQVGNSSRLLSLSLYMLNLYSNLKFCDATLPRWMRFYY